MKKIQKLQGIDTQMFFPDLGSIEQWVVAGYGDAGIKSLPDKLSSCGGTVVLLVNETTSKACVLGWKSKKLQRKIPSSLAGEALALKDSIGSCVYYKALLQKIYGDQIKRVPIVLFTDSKNLTRAINSTRLVADEQLIVDIAAIKDDIANGTVSSVRRVRGKECLADCLTKNGASAELLLKVLQTGEYKMPAGLEDDNDCDG